MKEDYTFNEFDNYMDKFVQIQEKNPKISSDVLVKTITKIIHKILSTTDPLDRTTLEQLDSMKSSIHKLKDTDIVNPINKKIDGIKKMLVFAKTHDIPKEDIIIVPKPKQRGERLKINKGTSLASAVIDQSLNDPVSKKMCLEILEDETPLICSSRTFKSFFGDWDKSTPIAKNFWVFQNKEADCVVCIPRMCVPEGTEAAEALNLLGYDADNLQEVAYQDLNSAINIFDKLTPKKYQENLASHLPKLFVPNKVKIGINFVGHGTSIKNLESVFGLTIKQSQSMITELEDRGMVYFNAQSCHLQGNELSLLKNLKLKSAVTICSATDLPSRALYEVDSNIKLKLREHTKYWQEIQTLFSSGGLGGSKVTAKPEDLKNALQHIYGHDIWNLPVYLNPDKRHHYFAQVNVKERGDIIDYQTLMEHAIHPSENRTIPFSSIESNWAKSDREEDRINHCQHQIHCCRTALATLKQKDPYYQTVESLLKDYNDLNNEYLKHEKSTEKIQKIKDDIVKEEKLLVNTPFSVTELKPNKLKPFKVDKDYVAIYPQVIMEGIELKKGKNSNAFPVFISKVPDHHQTLIMDIQTDQGSPKDVIVNSLSMNLSETKSATFTEHTFVVKKLRGVAEGKSVVLENVIVSTFINKTYAIYQRQGQWFQLDNRVEKQLDNEIATKYLLQLMMQNKTSKEAIDYSAGDLLAAKQSREYIDAFYKEQFMDMIPKIVLSTLDAMDRGDKGAFSEYLQKLTPSQRQDVLLCAMAQKKLDYMMALKDFDCHIDELDLFGHSPLIRALFPPQWDIIKVLLELHANPNEMFSIEGKSYSPLDYAVATDDTQGMELLASYNGKVSPDALTNRVEKATDAEGFTKLERVLKLGMDPNLPDSKGLYPLYYVLTSNKENPQEVIDLLGRYGAKFDLIKKDAKQTPVSYCLHHNLSSLIPTILKYKPDLSLLVPYKPDSLLPSEGETTALALAIKKGELELAWKMVTENNAPFFVFGTHTQEAVPPLLEALLSGNESFIDKILDYEMLKYGNDKSQFDRDLLKVISSFKKHESLIEDNSFAKDKISKILSEVLKSINLKNSLNYEEVCQFLKIAIDSGDEEFCRLIITTCPQGTFTKQFIDECLRIDTNDPLSNLLGDVRRDTVAKYMDYLS